MEKRTVGDLAQKLGLQILAGEGDALSRLPQKVYTCDLLSFAMGRAPADCTWITVMGNVNTIAVATLCDCACVILADGVALDEQAKARANQQGVAVLGSSLPVFETALAVHGALCREA